MNCDKCGGEIRRGETYTAISRHTEYEDAPGVITVTDAELLAAYHLACAPGGARRLRLGVPGPAVLQVLRRLQPRLAHAH